MSSRINLGLFWVVLCLGLAALAAGAEPEYLSAAPRGYHPKLLSDEPHRLHLFPAGPLLHPRTRGSTRGQQRLGGDFAVHRLILIWSKSGGFSMREIQTSSLFASNSSLSYLRK
jgi:hypothetical protein